MEEDGGALGEVISDNEPCEGVGRGPWEEDETGPWGGCGGGGEGDKVERSC
jgi:hypothetical protein